jgi:hypothetical protein
LSCPGSGATRGPDVSEAMVEAELLDYFGVCTAKRVVDASEHARH